MCLHAARFEFMALDVISTQRGKRDREGKSGKRKVSLLCEFLLINSPHYRTEIAKVNRHTYTRVYSRYSQSVPKHEILSGIACNIFLLSDTIRYGVLSSLLFRGSIWSYDSAYRIEISDAKKLLELILYIHVVFLSSVEFPVTFYDSHLLWSFRFDYP